MKQGIRAEKFILRHWWISDILRISELEPQYQKCKGRVELRGDIVKDDSGSYAVFTDQGSSASQVTAAKVMDITSRLPGCAGQAADAVSAYTQVVMEVASTFKNSKVRMPRYLGTFTEAQMVELMVQHGRPSCSPREESVRSSSVRTIMGKAIWGSSVRTRLGKSFKLGVFICQPSKKDCSYQSMWTISNQLAGKTENIKPTWKILMKDVDLGEPTSLLDQLYLGCTQREFKISNEIVANYRDIFESRISAGAKEKLLVRASGKPDAETISSWSMNGRSRKEMCGKILRACE